MEDSRQLTMEDVSTLLPLCASDELSKRVKAYHSLTDKLSSLPQTSEWGDEITAEVAKQIICNIKKDLFSEEKDVSYEVTGFFGCFLGNEKLMDLLTMEEEQQILDSLIKLLEETKEKPVLTRGLWSLAQSKFECEVYSKNLPRLLNLIIDILKCDPTSIIIYETLQVMKSLMESVPSEILEKTEDWFPKIFVHLFHDALRIRGVAYSCLNFCQLFSQKNSISHFNKHIIPFIPMLKSQYCKQMTKFVEENCTFVLKIWRLLVIILSKDLHTGTTLINGLLEVVEKAFKSTKPEYRIDAFKCWHVLIGNFSTDIEVLAHPKRLKLLIAPLKSNNAKTEDISFIKLHTWWFLVCKMGEKVSSHFDLVVVPLLKFCFNPNRVSQSGVNERTLLMSGGPPPCIKYSNLLLKSCEVLARILSHGHESTSSYNFSIPDLSHSVLTSTLFIKNSQLILGCVADALMSLDSSDKNHLDVGLITLHSIMKYVNSIVKANPNKKESAELVKELFSIYDFIEGQSKPGDSSSLFAYELIKMTTFGDQAFPRNVLNSRLYYIPVGSKLRDMMNGNLSNFLIHKLCRPVLLHNATNDAGFLELWVAVLQKSKPSNKLVFLEAVMEELEHVVPYLCPQNSKVLISMWMVAAKVLYDYLEETQQINQGDNSEHDWTCIYNTLLFPLKCSEDNLSGISSTIYEDLIVIWTNLWNLFTSLTPLTVTAEPNCEAEFIVKKILCIVQEKLSAPPDASGFTLIFFTDVLYIILNKFRFKELGKKPKKMLQSPLKPRRKSQPLHNLSSTMELLNLLMEKTLRMVSHWRHKGMQKLCLSFIKIFNNISQDRMVWVTVSSVLDVIKKALEINPTAKFNAEVERTFVSMWNAFCGLIECRVVPKLTHDQLAFLSPVISVALQSSHLGLRQRTRLMWSTSFASTSHSIPNDLFDILQAVALPPASISEMPSGELQSLSPKENIPTHISGSFLNREKNQEVSPFSSAKLDLKAKLSPLLTKSPLSNKSPKGKSQAKPKLNIDDLKAEEFVTVSSSKTGKRVLTPHQVEKMRERASDIPALYNDMSQSVSQLPSQFLSQDSFDSQNQSSVSNKKAVSSDLNFKGKIIKGKCLSTKFDLTSDTPKGTSEDKSKNRSYSDEDLDEVLRDASLEMERSFSDSVILLECEKEKDFDEIGLRKSKRPKNSLTYTNNGIVVNDSKSLLPSKNNSAETDSHYLKRKSLTPSKKSIDDVRKSLKGIPKWSRTAELRKVKLPKHCSPSSSTDFPKGKDSSISDSDSYTSEPKSKETSPLATPLKSPIKSKDLSSPLKSSIQLTSKSPSKSKDLSPSKKNKVSSPTKNDYQDVELDDEIPNSQMETSKASTLLLFPFSPRQVSKTLPEKLRNSPAKDRPRRHKRKSIFEDESIYITPPKRSKSFLSFRKEERKMPENCIILEDDSNQSKTSNVVPASSDETSSSDQDSYDSDIKKINKSKIEDRFDSDSDLQVINESKKSDQSPKEQTPQKSETTSLLKSLMLTPSKITRSGRRIVAPNKDMPEPMTPPGVSPRKTLSTEQLEPQTSQSPDLKEVPKSPPLKTSSPKRVQIKECIIKCSKTHLKKLDTREDVKNGEVLKINSDDDEDEVKEDKNMTKEEKSEDKESKSCVDSVESQSDKTSMNTYSSGSEEEEESREKEKKIVRKESVKEAAVISNTRESKRMSLRRKDLKRKEITKSDENENNLSETLSDKPVSPNKEVNIVMASAKGKANGEHCNSVSVIRVKDKIPDSNQEEKQASKNILKDDLKSSSMIIKTVESCSVDPVASSSTTSAIFVSSSNHGEVNGAVNTDSMNLSKYKVIFSPNSIKPSQDSKDENKGLLLSEEMHIANGGIVFTKTPSQKTLVNKNYSEQNLKPLLKKSKSLEKFFPVKTNSSSHTIPMLSQINFKKVGNIAQPVNRTDNENKISEVVEISQLHSKSPSKGSVTKVCIKDLQDLQNTSNQNLVNENTNSSGESLFQTEVNKSLSSSTIRLSSPTKKQSLSPRQPITLSPELNVLSKSKDEFSPTIKKARSLDKLYYSEKSYSSPEKFHLFTSKSSPLLEGKSSPSNKSNTLCVGLKSPEKSISSPIRTCSSESPKVINWSPKIQESGVPPPRLIISPTHKTQKILFISSPKNSSSPLQKIIYSPHTFKSPLKIKSPCKNETNNQVFVLKNNVKPSESERKNSSDENLNEISSNTEVISQPKENASNKIKIIVKEDEKSEINSVSEMIRKTPVSVLSGTMEEEEKGHHESSKAPINGENAAKEEKVSNESNNFEKVEASDDMINENPEGKEKVVKRKVKPLMKKSTSKFAQKKVQRTLKKKPKFVKRKREKFVSHETENEEVENFKPDKDVVDVSDDKEVKNSTEKDSPDKVSSKLSNSVSTPERKKLSVMKVQIPGSRAAIMLACAKRTMRTRADDNLDPTSAIEDARQLRSGGVINEGNALQQSPGITPSRKRPLSDVYPDGKPWAKHEPSPGASPCGSILKKRQADDEGLIAVIGEVSELVEGSPSTSKNRRVSFADPPVSESVEIPPSPKVQKGHKAQKRLDMTQALDSAKNFMIQDSQDSQDTYEISLDSPNCSQPLYSSLLTCLDHVDLLAPLLTSPSLVESLKVVFKDRGLKTVGDFCAMSEMELQSFPVRSPKTVNTIKCLKKYEGLRDTKQDDVSEPCTATTTSTTTTTTTLTNGVSTESEITNVNGTVSDQEALSTLIEKDDAPPENPAKKMRPSPCDPPPECVLIEYGPDDANGQESEEEKNLRVCFEDSTTVGLGSATTSVEMKEPMTTGLEETTNTEIKESEFPKIFCQQIERDTSAIPSFVEGLSAETRLKLLETLTSIIPYKNVIDMFHQYLTRQNIS